MNSSHYVKAQCNYIINSLTARSTYRVKVRHNSAYGSTEWSDYKIYLTAIENAKEAYSRVKLFARGTSAVNHEESVIKVDDTVILQKANFRGLYLVALNRLTLNKVYSGHFDLMRAGNQVNVTDNFKNYTIDSSLNVAYTESSVTVERNYTNEVSLALFNKLAEFDEETIIIIVSSNAWELNFNVQLGNMLQSFGGFYIKEFQYQYSRRFSEETRRRFLDYIDISEQK